MKKASFSTHIAASCALASCLFSALAAETPEAKNWREVTSGTQSRIEEPTQLVIQTADEWSKWWGKHTSDPKQLDNSELPKPPKVDFEKETILIATMGMRSTGGHTIRFSQIVREGESLKAVVSTTSPGSDAMVTMALTYPFAVIAIPKHQGPVQFVMGK